MTQESASDQDPDDAEVKFVEVDPSGRYGRYKEVLGRGAFKKVYRAFDELEGIEVAWNLVKVADLLRNTVDLERVYSEVHLLKTLKHKNIIKFYTSWVDSKNENINIITEIFTSGTLRQYRRRHKNVDLRALKKWARQILEGLAFLHSHDPPIIHRDLKCDNIFVNGNQGEVKIGDLGLACILRNCHSAHSVIGTPEFMAPELYEEDYNELVDIYAFGMTLLELVIFEYPYSECSNAAQIYKKVTSGIKPASLSKVTDLSVKEFIEKCIAKLPDRLPAKELLKDPFLRPDDDDESPGEKFQTCFDHSVAEGNQFQPVRHSEELNPDGRDFMIHGKRKDLNTIFLKLRIQDGTGQFRNIHFPFHVELDTPFAVASEMVGELDLTHQDVSNIAAKIDAEIRSYVPDFPHRELCIDQPVNEAAINEMCASEAQSSLSPVVKEPMGSGNYVLERLPSGRTFWCESPKTADGGSPLRRRDFSISHADPAMIGESRSLENEQSLDGSEERNYSHDQTENDLPQYAYQDAGASKLSHLSYAKINGSSDPHSVYGVHPSGENYNTLKGNYSDALKLNIEKVDNLLIEQRKELDELRRKHESAIANLLMDLDPDMRHRVVSICGLKMSGHHKTGDEASCSAGNVSPCPSQMLQDFSKAVEGCGEQKLAAESCICFPCFNFRLHAYFRRPCKLILGHRL